MPTSDRVVLAQHHAVGVVPAVLTGDIGVAGPRGGAELDDRAYVVASYGRYYMAMVSIFNNGRIDERQVTPVSAHCQLTGSQPGFGNAISHSHRRTSRRFDPNIQRKRYWLPGEGRHVRLTLSARAIKTIDVIGIEAAVARIRARGGKV